MDELVKQPLCIIMWNGKNVTENLKPFLSSVEFTNHEEGASDDVTITLDNGDGLWSGAWNPVEGDTMQIYLGYDSGIIDCGLFQIDEKTYSGAPHIVEIKSISSFFTQSLRTKSSKAFENQTLRQIAQYFCKKHGLKLIDDTDNMLSQINLDRQTQEEETDLQFLSKISKEYGFIFSIKGDKLVFTTYYNLDNAEAVRDISIYQISNYSITEKTYDTYASSYIVKRNSRKNKLLKAEYSDILNPKNGDALVASGYASSGKQAEQKVKGGLWGKNKSKQFGTLNDLEGDPKLVAGININLTGLGENSGKWHIVSAGHKISGDGAYTTLLEIRKTGLIPKPRRVPAIKKEKTAYDENQSDILDNTDDIEENQ